MPSYLFPVPFQGTVTNFEASICSSSCSNPFCLTLTDIDGVNIITHVRDRNSAPKERADDPNNQAPIMCVSWLCAVTHMTRFVTEQDRLYLQLKAIVPNIPAGKTVNFKLTFVTDSSFAQSVLNSSCSYVTEITVDEERLRLSIPLKFTTVKRPPKPDAGYFLVAFVALSLIIGFLVLLRLRPQATRRRMPQSI